VGRLNSANHHLEGVKLLDFSEEFWRTARYACHSNARTVRLLSILILVAVIFWIIVL